MDGGKARFICQTVECGISVLVLTYDGGKLGVGSKTSLYISKTCTQQCRSGSAHFNLHLLRHVFEPETKPVTLNDSMDGRGKVPIHK